MNEEITFQKFPILRLLEWGGELEDHPLYKKARQMSERGKTPKMDGLIRGRKGDSEEDMRLSFSFLSVNWPRLRTAFSHKVDLMSKEFAREEDVAWDVLKDKGVVWEYLKGHFRGTLLFDKNGSSVSYEMEDTVFDEEGVEFKSFCVIVVDKDGAASLICCKEGELGVGFFSRRLLDWYGEKGRYTDAEAGARAVMSVLELVLHHEAFMHFASVRTKYLARPGTRDAKGRPEGEPLNRTQSNIRHLTPSWYTTTVRTEGFPRRGHFRMQRYKEGSGWTHRLKWIDATYVSGYTRKARKLLNEEAV